MILERNLSYVGTIAKICRKSMNSKDTTTNGIRVCCESSLGEVYAACGPANNGKICRLCNPHPEKSFNSPFYIFTGKRETKSKIRKTSEDEKLLLYGMPGCPTHTFNISEYDVSISKHGDLNINNSIFNQSNYCINYGKRVEQGDQQLILPNHIRLNPTLVLEG